MERNNVVYQYTDLESTNKELSGLVTPMYGCEQKCLCRNNSQRTSRDIAELAYYSTGVQTNYPELHSTEKTDLYKSYNYN